MNNKIKLALKIAVSMILLGIMIYAAGPKEILAQIGNGNPLYMFYGFMLIVCGTILAAYRWHIVMKSLGFAGDFVFYLKSYFTGIFFNQLLPSSIGGDAFRVLDVARLGYKKRQAFVGVLADRGIGIAGIFAVNLIFNNIFTGFLPPAVYKVLNIISVSGLIGFFGFMFIHKIEFLNRYKWYSVLSVPSGALLKSVSGLKKGVFHTAASVMVHILTFAGVYAIAIAFGVSLPISAFMVIMPPVILLTIIPVSLAGWGVRETSMAGLFKFADIAPETSISISIIFGFTYVIQGLPGIYFWVKNKDRDGYSNES